LFIKVYFVVRNSLYHHLSNALSKFKRRFDPIKLV